MLEHVERGACNEVFVERARQLRLVYDFSAPSVHEVGRRLHALQLRVANQVVGVAVEGGVYAHHVRGLEQVVERQQGVGGGEVLPAGGVVGYARPKRLGDGRHAPADVAHADYPEALARQLVERAPVVRKQVALRVLSAFDVSVEVGGAVHERKQQRKGNLRYAGGGVAGNVLYADVFLRRVLQLYVVRPRGGDAYQAQLGQRVHDVRGDLHLVADDNIGVPAALHDFAGGGIAVHGEAAQLLQRGKAGIAQRGAVKQDYVHGAWPPPRFRSFPPASFA